MTITTYDELKTSLETWLARDDLTANIPDFITLAEAKLNRTLAHPSMETRGSATVATTSDEPEFVSLPSDFQQMRRIYLSGVSGEPTLDYRTEVQLSKYRTATGDSAGQPMYYTIFGNELELAPTPDDDYVLEMVYRGNLTPLSSDDTSNWLLAFAPDVYLYGALLQSAPFTRDPDNAQIWGAAYQAAIDELNKHGRRLKYGAAPLVITRGSEVTP